MASTKNIFRLKALLLLLLIIPFSAIAQKKGKTKRDTAECLLLSGEVNVDCDTNDMISVELVLDNEVVEQHDVHSYQPFKFYLLRDKHYTIKLTKEMFIKKTISISTELPKDLKVKSLYKFHFETDLVKAPDLKSQHADAMDFPIALIRYDEVKKKFEYSPKYNDMINDQIDKDMYKIYGGDGDAPPPPPQKPKKDKTTKK